jgi:GAF domain-containing protein
LSREVVQIADILADAGYETTAAARTFGARSILAVPMLREGNPIGAILIYRREPALFPEKQVALLQTFADQAVIAVENARLFKALEARNAELAEALDQQTATSEILRVISRSPTDVQPVFDAIVDNAVRLCDGMFGIMFRYDGELLHFVAEHRCSGEAIELLRSQYPMPPRGFNAHAIVDRAVIHSPDVLADTRVGNLELVRILGYRSNICVPMLKEDRPIGIINVFGAEAKPFSENQTVLLRTFADQAVIAIENAPLRGAGGADRGPDPVGGPAHRTGREWVGGSRRSISRRC